MDNCKHRWADSPSDVGEGIYCTRCGDMANVTQLREQIADLMEMLEHAEVQLRFGDIDTCVTCAVRIEKLLAKYRQEN